MFGYEYWICQVDLKRANQKITSHLDRATNMAISPGSLESRLWNPQYIRVYYVLDFTSFPFYKRCCRIFASFSSKKFIFFILYLGTHEVVLLILLQRADYNTLNLYECALKKKKKKRI